MTQPSLHADAVVIDGLVVSKWSRELFADMRKGGLTAANCTCSVWENFRQTVDNIGAWRRRFAEHADLIAPVRTTADIGRAKAEGKVGIILGTQNTWCIEDRLDYLAVFKGLGVGVMQLTYNTQNLVGSGCFEGRDSGLSDFGREAIEAMNGLGIAIDLSHVGPLTSRETIEHSRKPVTFSHCAPAALKAHPRNKSDEDLRKIVAKGGHVGVVMLAHFLPKGADSTIDDYLDAIAHTLNVCGEDHVGIGTDFTQGQDADFFTWLRRDKGYARTLVSGVPGVAGFPKGLETLADYPNLTAAMERRRWPEPRIRKVLGLNWLRFLKEAWGE